MEPPQDPNAEIARTQLTAEMINLVGERNKPIAETLSFFPDDATQFISGQKLVRQHMPNRERNIWYAYDDKDRRRQELRSIPYGLIAVQGLVREMRGYRMGRQGGDFFQPDENAVDQVLREIDLKNNPPKEDDPHARRTDPRLSKLIEILDVTNEEVVLLKGCQEARIQELELRTEADRIRTEMEKKIKELNDQASQGVFNAAQAVVTRSPRQEG